MKLAFVYAGQGAQRVGMGKDFYENYEIAKEIYDNKNDLDFDIKDMSFNGPEEELRKTEHTQIALVTFAIMVTKLLKSENIEAEMLCGLSLGEYSALYAAGVLSEKDVQNLCYFRGKFMAETAAGEETAMYAILKLGRETIAKACKDSKDLGIVQICNYNCPGQIVIGGSKVAVEKAAELCKERGAKRCIPLKVSGPFHTEYMKSAGVKLEGEFKCVNFENMNTPVVFNATGKELAGNETIEELLVKQVSSAVMMEDSINYMIEKGVDTFIEIGPGSAVSGFIKKIDKSVTVYNIDTAEDYEKVLKVWREKYE